MSSDKDIRYGVWDKIVDQGLSKFSFENLDECTWDVGFENCWDNRAIDFHLFESKADAEKAIKLPTKSFLKQDSKSKIDFVIYELTEPKTMTSYLAKEIKSHKSNKAKKR